MAAAVTTLVLLVLGTPLAWWLARTTCRLRAVIEALITLPLVVQPLQNTFSGIATRTLEAAALFAHLNVNGNLVYGLRRTPAAQQRIHYAHVIDWRAARAKPAPRLNSQKV